MLLGGDSIPFATALTRYRYVSGVGMLAEKTSVQTMASPPTEQLKLTSLHGPVQLVARCTTYEVADPTVVHLTTTHLVALLEVVAVSPVGDGGAVPTVLVTDPPPGGPEQP